MSQQINLLNPALRRARDWLTATPLALVCVILLALIVVVYAAARVRANGREREAERLSAQLKAEQARLVGMAKAVAARKPNAELLADLANARAQLQGRQAIMAALDGGAIGNTSGFSDYLRGFARQVPSGLWLTGFTIDAGGSAMEIRGRMLDPAALPEYIRRLNSEPAFQGRSFATLSIRRPDDKPGAAAPGSSSAGPAAYVDFVLTQSASAAAEKMP
ncbi:MAG TPA: PilN domain-containing protein [Rhodocyclaceae bacterium]|nr:PilN domain-containing protein [Rhodocyclaceae bacterium]